MICKNNFLCGAIAYKEILRLDHQDLDISVFFAYIVKFDGWNKITQFHPHIFNGYRVITI